MIVGQCLIELCIFFQVALTVLQGRGCPCGSSSIYVRDRGRRLKKFSFCVVHKAIRSLSCQQVLQMCRCKCLLDEVDNLVACCLQPFHVVDACTFKDGLRSY
jgi:hypothetical protein